MRQKHPFKSPPTLTKGDGSLRRVGFELEFSGLSLIETIHTLQALLGGKIKVASAVEQLLQTDRLGDFKVELDWDYLKHKAAQNTENGESAVWVEPLGQAAALLVPVEVVCPPLPITDLSALLPAVAALRNAGAVGTEESFLAAYGVHINAEIPRLDAATLNAYLKAFALLQWWLVEAHDVDTTRRISPYVDLYPEAYLKQLLSRSQPTMDNIFDDYLEHNASRNRALDLLPLLAHIDIERLQLAVDDPKVNPRPTFHYRLPNCHIEREDWSLASPWNTWCLVEQLAHRPNDLAELSAAFLDAQRPILGANRAAWVEYLNQWLKKRALA